MPPLTIEAFLARIYTDAAARAAFLRDPAGEAARAGLPPTIAAAMADLDAPGVEATAAGLARKTRSAVGAAGGVNVAQTSRR